MRRLIGCGASALLLGLTLLPASPAPAMPLLKRLLGTAPDSSQAAGLNGPWPPGGNVGAALDRGFITPEELVWRRLGGDVSQTGTDCVFRSIDLNGVGRGRTAWMMDGHALETSTIHWTNPLTVPLRALESMGEESVGGGPMAGKVGRGADPAAANPQLPGAGAAVDSTEFRLPPADDLFIPPGGGGALLALTTAPGPARPVSAVSFTGGDYDSRLGSFSFRRRFGRTAVNLDGVSMKQGGWTELGENRRDQGFARFDFPVGAGVVTVSAGGGSGKVEFLTGGTEESKASRLAVDSRHRVRGGVLRLSLLRLTSGLNLTGSVVDRFELGVNQLRAGGAWGPEGGRVGLTLAAALGLESRHGVVEGDEHFNSVEAMARWRRALPGGWQGSGQLVLRQRELTGLALEPALDMTRRLGGAALRLTAARSTGIPGLQFHTDAARPDLVSLTAQLNRILELEDAESHWTFGGALDAGGPGSGLSGRLFAGATRSDHDAGAWVPSLALAPGSAWSAPTEGFWTPRVDAGLTWRPRTDLELGALGQFRGLDLERRPGQTRVRGEGWITLRRIYFAPELDLAATLGGRYAGPRHSGRGDAYPGALQGYLTLTATMRTLTLFWRFENLSGEYIESDLYDESGLPVPLPGLQARIGATLHLMD